MGTQNNQETSSRNDQPDGKFDQSVKNANLQGTNTKDQSLTSQLSSDDDENAGAAYSENLMGKAESQVRATEDASLQDDTYAFDEDNTSNEEYHDAGDAADFDVDNDDDYIQ